MNYKSLLEKIELFREKSEIGKLIVFVGAGVSCNVKGMPSWSGLVEKMANSINYSKCDSCKKKTEECIKDCKFKNEYSTDEFLKIPQYVYNKNPKMYKRILQENIIHPQTDAAISSAIFDINPKHIITTNYDALLESSSNDFTDQYQVIIKDKNLLNSQKSKYIVKMHGDISELDTIVLKEDDYLNFSQNHILIELFVKSLLVDHTVLFVGYSLNDYNVKLIINWINYMRIQNNALDHNQKIGYIILDEKSINKREIKYFANNQIDVININKVNLINDIPTELEDERGKRLYSFLKLIADPSLDNSIEYITKAVSFLNQYSFVDYNKLLKSLHINQYTLKLGELMLYNESDYDMLETFLASSTEEVNMLKRLFKNACIYSIGLNDFKIDKKIIVSEVIDNDLQNNHIYNLYLSNEYGKIREVLETLPEESNERIFYSSLLGVVYKLNKYDKDFFSKLSTSEKLSFLFNDAAVYGLLHFLFKSEKVENYIDNIPSLIERKIFSFYNNIFEGNGSAKISMQSALKKLNSSTGQISIDFSKIQNYAYTQYYRYFYNNLNFKGYSDLRQFMEIYIEAILSMNRKEEEKDDVFGFGIKTNRYCIEKLDIDIITKLISTKQLLKLIDDYNIEKIDIASSNIDFLTNCFINLIDTIVEFKVYGFKNDLFQVMSNLVVILSKVDLHECDLALISKAIEKFLSDSGVMQYYFSVYNFERRESLKVLEHLTSLIVISLDINWIKKLVSNDNFWDYSVNTNFQVLRKFICNIVSKELLKKQQIELKEMISEVDDFNKKIILLRLLFKYIVDTEVSAEYKSYIASNFEKLHTEAIFDFVFSNWLSISEEQADNFIESVLILYKNQIAGMRVFPNPLDLKLECIYILHLHGIIADLDKLKALKPDRPHLQFLLDADNFDYTQVDFSNYMWVNFARHDKYMKHFIKNKHHIILKIKERINHGKATDDEKKILYGFLLNNSEIWEN